MELNEYQRRAMATCMPSCENFSYMMLNLVAEVGEFAGKVAKAIRKENLVFTEDGHYYYDGYSFKSLPSQREYTEELKKEAGDILWQLSGLCDVMDWDLEDVAQCNLDKLASRLKRGVIDGNGDNR